MRLRQRHGGEKNLDPCRRDCASHRLNLVNAAVARVQVLDISDAAQPRPVSTLDVGGDLGDPQVSANSVAVGRDGLVAVAVQAGVKTDPGWAVFYDGAGGLVNRLRVGALPDMVTFTPNGKALLVANEGEPADDFSFDPEGSVSVIDMRKPVATLNEGDVRTAGFRAYDRGARMLHSQVRVFGPDVTGRADGALTEPGRIARNLEPEYITVGHDSRTAYVTLQEANAVAVLDIASASIVDVWPLGYKDHLLPGNEFDASDRDGQIRLANWPVYGVYQPDAIASYRWRGQTLLVTANEGDAREWGAYADPGRMRSLTSSAPICSGSPRLQAFLASNDLGITTSEQLRDNVNLGRLNLLREHGLRADGSCYEDLYSFGGLSFSIWTNPARPASCNTSTTATSPPRPAHRPPVTLGPEGMLFIDADSSPIGVALLAVANEVSGTTTLFQIDHLR